MDWHLITCEYPPQSGGVSDYSHLIANGLAATGETVHVWCSSIDVSEANSEGVIVHRVLGRPGPKDLRRVGRLLDKYPEPRRLLVQWVPHGFGYRSMNLPFCLWLWQRAKLKHDRVEIMVHEPFLDFGGGSAKRDVAAAVHRLMVVILLRAANHVWVSIPRWETRLRPFLLGQPKTFSWLPLPSNIAIVDDPVGIARVRAKYAIPDALLVGHFGAYDRYMIELMLELLPSLLNVPDQLSVMLLGKGSLELRDRLTALYPGLSHSVHATGELSAADVSRHVSACDLMLQPYQDGISGRRTSVMTALSHGVPVVTTAGDATESCWAESQSVELVAAANIPALVETTHSLLKDASARRQLGAAARQFYESHFTVSHVLEMLRAGTAER